MRALALLFVLVLALVLGSGTSLACQTNSDCEIGSHCEIPAGQLDGACVNDVAPAPIDEQETVETPPIDDDADEGNECVSSDECGVGGRCVKQPGAVSGVCTGGM